MLGIRNRLIGIGALNAVLRAGYPSCSSEHHQQSSATRRGHQKAEIWDITLVVTQIDGECGCLVGIISAES